MSSIRSVGNKSEKPTRSRIRHARFEDEMDFVQSETDCLV
jgi:hypothetical protein